MRRKVKRILIDRWIDLNGPDGLSRLAVESGISASTISKIRCGSVPPKKESTLRKICEALGLGIDEVFPLVRAKGQAS